jgi:beta-galactosidase
MKRIVVILLGVLLSINGIASTNHTFEIKGGHFVHNGKIIQIHSGEFHYERVPHEYWRHRLQMMRAMGLNTVATYVFWNFHEPEQGEWSFKGDHDLAAFIRTAGEEGLMVILRPGPYACAEWEYGGFPYWLQNIPNLQVRRDNEPFLRLTQEYFNHLYAQVKDLLVTKGGPLIMLQCENEFGSYVAQCPDIPLTEHKSYLSKIKDQIQKAGFDIPLFTSDGSWLFNGGTMDGVLPTANGEGNVENLKQVVNKYHNGEGPYMVAEFYPGWLDHWGEPFVKSDAHSVAVQTEKYLKNDVSFNFYMAFGGTNFGFSAGANYDDSHDIQPDLTSYDYDAPINEAGWETPKFDSIRTVIQRYVKEKLPVIPVRIPVIIPSPVKLAKAVTVFDFLNSNAPVTNEQPMTFEQLKQCSGYVCYSRHFNQPISGKLELSGLRDYAVVYVNKKKIGVLDRSKKIYSIDVNIPFNATLQILVENMGRINYGPEIAHNNKGIISPVSIAGNEITGDWEMRPMPMSEMPDISKCSSTHDITSETLNNMPVIYQGSFSLDKTGDTFIDMTSWGKGIIFVNGHNLGRYWKIGPQQTLYLPGCWLQKGQNQIVVFEQLNEVPQTTVSFTNMPILNNLKN